MFPAKTHFSTPTKLKTLPTSKENDHGHQHHATTMESPTMDEVITLRNALRMRRLMSSPWVWVWGLPPRVPTEYELNECWKESDKVVPMYTHAEMVANHGCLCPENYKDERNEVYSCHEAQWRRGWDKESKFSFSPSYCV